MLLFIYTHKVVLVVCFGYSRLREETRDLPFRTLHITLWLFRCVRRDAGTCQSQTGAVLLCLCHSLCRLRYGFRSVHPRESSWSAKPNSKLSLIYSIDLFWLTHTSHLKRQSVLYYDRNINTLFGTISTTSINVDQVYIYIYMYFLKYSNGDVIDRICICAWEQTWWRLDAACWLAMVSLK